MQQSVQQSVQLTKYNSNKASTLPLRPSSSLIPPHASAPLSTFCPKPPTAQQTTVQIPFPQARLENVSEKDLSADTANQAAMLCTALSEAQAQNTTLVLELAAKVSGKS